MIKNLIVITNSKSKEEFQQVKVFSVNELLGYVMYFQPIFSSSDIQRIADFLLGIKSQSKVFSGRG